MSTNSGLFWLASYPKSGNTWFRIFLANLLNKSTTPINLNEIHVGKIASGRDWIDSALGFDSADLDHNELDQLRPAIYTWYGEQNNQINYHKIHDAYTFIDDGSPLIPTKGCLGAIYFIRNPLDVVISFANHSNVSIDQAIECMSNKKFAFCKNIYQQNSQLRQCLLSWSLHVQSWITAPNIQVLVLRYEDLKEHSLTTFTKAVNFLQLNSSQAEIECALNHASIETLQQQEQEFGFNEKPSKVNRFFRKGIVGDWRNTLTPTQVTQIVRDHGEMMHKYGYDQNL